MIQMQWFLHYRMGVFLGRPPRARRGARPFDDATRRAGADGLALRRPIDHTLHTEVPMKLPLQISFHGMEPSKALEAAAIKNAHKLEEFYSDIVSGEQLQKHQHQHQGRPFAVWIDLILPGCELCVNRVQDEDAYVALRDSFDDTKRQLEDAAAPARPGEAAPGPAGRRSGASRRRGALRLHPNGRWRRVLLRSREPVGLHLRSGADRRQVQFLPEVDAEGRQAKRVSFGKHHGG